MNVKTSHLIMVSSMALLLFSQKASAIECYINNRSPSIAQGTSKTIGSNCDRYGNTAPISITSNAPAGITLAASPNPTTGKTSSLTFNVAPSVAIGAKNFNVTFTAGSERSTQPMSINVTRGTSGSGGSSATGGTTGSGGRAGSASGGSSGSGGVSGTSGSGGTAVIGSYSISSSGSISVQQAQSGTIPITINRTSFTSSVALSVTGLPVGVTAAFSPSSTTANTSTLTLTVASGVNPATYTLTVRGTSGSTVQSTPLTLTVTPQPATFTLATPTALSIQRGNSTSTTLNINRTNMTENIAFVLSGLPSGVTGSCPATTSSSTICSLSSTSDAPTGTVTVMAQASSSTITRSVSFPLTVSLPTPPPTTTGLRAFPGAEGFGATETTGGRGGVVCKVTNRNNSGAGSLQACMDIPGPAYILFTISGIIDSSLECHYGNKTIAGQTSPAGIITRGMIFDDVYETNPNCYNVIIRHMRSRPAPGERSATGYVNDDAIRLDGMKKMVIDHVSFERAPDELFQLSRSAYITIQNSLLGAPQGGHKWAGMLMNYSTTAHDQNYLSIHHNLWTGVMARFPEISCEENGDDRIGTTNCTNKHLQLELSNNMISDPDDPIWYNRCTGTNAGNDCSSASPSFFLDMNWVGNYMRDRTGSDNPFINPDLMADSRNHIYYEDNFFEVGLASLFHFNTASLNTPFSYPTISYTPGDELPAYMMQNVGAFPRDPMDQRLVGYLSQNINNTPTVSSLQASSSDTFALLTPACTSPLDSNGDTDNDGMPDSWERTHGLQVGVDDHNGTTLSSDGYTNIEVFLNGLADDVITEGVNAICKY